MATVTGGTPRRCWWSPTAPTSSPGRACATWRRVHLIAAGQLNTYDVLVSDHVVFTEDSLAQFVARAASRQEGQQ